MTDARYTRTAISLHWLIALLIFAGWGLGYYMNDLPASPAKLKYFNWHKWIGVTVFILAVLRSAWLVSHPWPPWPSGVPAWQMRAARLSHFLLYLLMLVIPVSGWLMSSARGFQTVYLGLVPLPDLLPKNKVFGDLLEEVHRVLAYGLAGLVAIHIAAVFKHQFVDRDNLLARMIPFLSSRSPEPRP